MELGFEWDEAKAKANFVERLDDRKDYGEERFVIIGMADGRYCCSSLTPSAASAFA
jgi:uncharacterized DUF497 family protein